MPSNTKLTLHLHFQLFNFMKLHLLLLLFFAQTAAAQKLKKADKTTLANLKNHIAYLADDKLEGRRTGTNGEKLASAYLVEQYKKNGLQPRGDNGSYLQAFTVNDGKMVSPSSHVFINDYDLKINEDYFPFVFCPNTSLQATTATALHETGNPWFWDLKETLEQNKNNPHFDIKDAIKTRADADAKKGATALLIYNSSSINDDLKFEPKSKDANTAIPVIYISKNTAARFFKDETATLDVKIKIAITEKMRTGYNVVAYKDNAAKHTIVIGAHYDHLGYGEDHNSMHTGDAAIHNGADDNASGTAAIVEMSRLLQQKQYSNCNYLFVSFSGEELGLYGSKYFTENPTVSLNAITCMINLDMVGRLNDSSRTITIGGYGTSPMWSSLINTGDSYFKIKIDSSGSGPSDHTSFYRKDIPVLFFFTGLHTDYHKPTDDADKINHTGTLQIVKYICSITENVSKQDKLPFTKTREAAMGTKTSFKVSLGIMPDYTFSGNGVRADGVSEGKLAQKIGLKAGDVLTQLGNYKFADVQSYMEALSKFKKGDATTLKILRDNKEMNFDIVF
jgi:aminopeptidase YwaD